MSFQSITEPKSGFGNAPIWKLEGGLDIVVIINFVVGSKLLTDVEAWRSHFRHSYLIGMECDPGIGSCKYFWVMYGKTGEQRIVVS